MLFDFNKDMKKYIINEERLIELITNELKLYCLENDGVDNWTWAYEGRKKFIEDAVNDRLDEIPENFDFEDVAKLDLENFELF